MLLVEDEDEVRTPTTRLLALCGYEVTAVKGPREAMAMLEERAFDLVLSDFDLGADLDGGDVLRRARELYPAAHRVCITGNEVRVPESEGDYLILRKPFDLDALLAAIAPR